MKKLLIWGAGDQGIVTLDCALMMRTYSWIHFLEIKEKGHRKLDTYQIYQETTEDLPSLFHSFDEVIVATGDNHLREQKTALLQAMNIPLATIIHPTAMISATASIASGCTILANAVVSANASIDTGCIINTSAIVEHDCIVEAFVNISPKAAMAGHTKIGRKSFLGIGSTIIDEITIGKEVIIGAGAVVLHDIPDHATAYGVPASIKNS